MTERAIKIMTKKVLEVTEVTLSILKKQPPILVIACKGNVPTDGWSNGQLIPYIYIAPPADGIYEFDFVADEPTGFVPQVITEIAAAPFEWEGFPETLKGVKVYASTNYKTAII
jgi:hypothetical protein